MKLVTYKEKEERQKKTPLRYTKFFITISLIYYHENFDKINQIISKNIINDDLSISSLLSKSNRWLTCF
jgi:hypothetical protein